MFLSLLIISGAYAGCEVTVEALPSFPKPINEQVLLWADESTEGVADPSFVMIQEYNFLWASDKSQFSVAHHISKPRLKQLTEDAIPQLQHSQPKAKFLQAKLMYRWYKGQKISRLITCPLGNKCTITSYWVEQLGWVTFLKMQQATSIEQLEMNKHTNPLKYQFDIYGGTAGSVYFNKLQLNIFAVYNTTHIIDGCPLSTTTLVESPFHPISPAQPNGIIGFVFQ